MSNNSHHQPMFQTFPIFVGYYPLVILGHPLFITMINGTIHYPTGAAKGTARWWNSGILGCSGPRATKIVGPKWLFLRLVDDLIVDG